MGLFSILLWDALILCKDEIIFKCPNDLNVKITKSNGELVFDEDCCTNVSIILKNSGEIATSFLGSHNPQLVRILEKTLKQYFKGIKKTLRKEYKNDTLRDDDISVVNEDLPEGKKWSGEDVPDIDAKKVETKESKQSKSKKSAKAGTSKGTTPKQKVAPNSSQDAKPTILKKQIQRPKIKTK